MTGPGGRKQRVVVLGAGIAGLMAARQLVEGGLDVIVLDKGRGVGGRMATRRFDGGAFDHGAQFFTAEDPLFSRHVHHWMTQGWVRPWPLETGTVPFHLPNSTVEHHDPLFAVNGMTAVPKALARTLDVRTGTLVVRLQRRPGGWRIWTDNAETFEAEGLVITLPVPQAHNLLKPIRDDLPDGVDDLLASIRYQPVFSLMLQLADQHEFPNGHVAVNGSPIVRWIADNRIKMDGARTSALTVHAQDEFSREMENEPPETVRQQFLAGVRTAVDVEPVAVQLHRWRFAWPLNPVDQPWTTPGPAPLVLAGDGFAGARLEGGRIEGAALTGLSAAATLFEMMND